MKVKRVKPKKGCTPRNTMSLPREETTWVPLRKKDLGTLINGRFYVMDKSQEEDWWLSFDIINKRDCMIRQLMPQYFMECDDEDDEYGPLPCQLGDMLKDRYYVLKMLSKTCLSTVWLTFDIRKSKQRVVKISNSTSFGVILYEIELLEVLPRLQIDSQKIVQFKDKFREVLSSGNMHMCFVMEEMQSDLQEFQQKFDFRQVPLNTVKEVARNILSALNDLHKCGIIHYDIKPENVLVTQCSLNNSHLCPEHRKKCEKLHVKLTDFGNAKYANRHEIAYINTQAYSCPEAIIGLMLEPAADIWSVGCLIFEMATGIYLIPRSCDESRTSLEQLCTLWEFFGPMPKELLQRATNTADYYDQDFNLFGASELYPFSLGQLFEDWRWPKAIAQPFVAFLLQLLELDPHKRATAAECLQHPWLS